MLKSSLLTLCLSALPILPVLGRQYTIVNKCPMDINLIINGQGQGNLAKGASVGRTYPETWSGFIYTDTNGGNATTGEYTTRAGFYGEASFSNIKMIFKFI
jgi:hypothetical protein